MSAKILKFQPRSVGVWIRVSTEFQAQGESPEHHEMRARDFASLKEWDVVETYHLEAISGKSVINHPETQRMLADVRAGRISALVVSKFARLVRNTRELLEICDVFKEHRAEVISLDEPINITTSSGRLMLGVMASLAEWEREEIGARVAASVPIRAKLGKPLGGAAPFGYKWKDRKLVVNPREAPVRQLMFELFIQHKKKKKVARLLNEVGHRTRNGFLFSDTTIDRLLRDPTAKGVRRANHTRSTGDKKHWISKPRHEWVETPVEAIITVELYDQVNRILDLQRAKLSREGKTVVQLFGSKLMCACGTKMYAQSGTPKYTCKKCRNKLPIADMEKIFLGAVRSVFTHERVEILFERAASELHSKRKLLSSLIDKLATMRKEMDQCYRAHITGTLDQADFGRFYDPLKLQSRRVEGAIAELQGDIEVLQGWCSVSRAVNNARKVISEWWPIALIEKKVELVGNFVKMVRVEKNFVAIQFQHLAPFTQETGFDFGIFALLCGLEVSLPKNPDKTEVLETLEDIRGQFKRLATATVA